MSRDAPDTVARESFVGTGCDRLFVRDIGRGLPIVIVHGGPDFDHQYLLPEMDRLAESFRVVYYDQRGRGRSFRADHAYDVTIASEVADLDRVRDRFGFARVAVLGHSWGGLLAMEYATRHPERVSHLILMNTAPASRDDALALRAELARRRTPAQTARMAELRADPTFQAGDIEAEAEYYRIHFGTTLRKPDHLEAIIHRLRSAFTAGGVVVARAIEDGLYEDTWSRADYDLMPALERLDIPTLAIHGDDDFVPIAVVRRITDAIHRSELVVLPACGHFAYLEQPERALATVSAFVTTAANDDTY